MRKIIDWFRRKAKAGILLVATAVVFMQLLLPAYLDLVFDLLMVGLMAIMYKIDEWAGR